MTVQRASDQKFFECFSEFYQASAHGAYSQEHRAGGSMGQRFIHVRQDAFELVDAETDDIAFPVVHTSGRHYMADYGDGRCETHNFKAGDITVVPNQAVHHGVSDAHELTIFVLPQKTVSSLIDASGFEADVLVPHYGYLRENALASSTVKKMWGLAKHRCPSTRLQIDGLTLQFLAHMAQPIATVVPEKQSSVDNKRIMRVVDYVVENLASPLSLEELAEVACLSRSHFARTFKEVMGRTAWRYVHERRCERARDLLTKSPMSVAEIAYSCGFSNQAHFATMFRKEFRMTPIEYRERSR